jgi:hypothetical protein
MQFAASLDALDLAWPARLLYLPTITGGPHQARFTEELEALHPGIDYVA